MNNSAFLWLTSYVVNAVWQVAVLACAGWGLARLVKPAGPELQHKIWVATLMLATLVPATPVIQYYFAHRASTGGVSAAPTTVVAHLSGRQIPLRGSDLIVPPIAFYVVSGLYIAALLFSFLRLWWILNRTAALVRHAEEASMEPDYAELWHKSKERFSVQAAALLRSRDVLGPVTAGLWRPVLLLPATFMEDYSQNEFLAAVAHECAHMKRDDFRKNVFYEIVGLFTVFHPLTWFIKSQIAQTREMICDGMAAEQLPDQRTYALSLLQLARKMRAATSVVSHAMGMFDTRILERRIMTLTTKMPRLGRIQRSVWTVSAILLLSICAGGIGLMTRTVAAQTGSPSAQAPPLAGTKRATAPDLDCTYYDQKTAPPTPHPGTCAYDPKDKKQYLCYSNANAVQSESQIACEWKLRRADEWKRRKAEESKN
jgi:beta-lactamase regulating signal transducer with metallopeptidase domain